MATNADLIQLKGGTTDQIGDITPALREPVISTDEHTIFLGDGITQGGHQINANNANTLDGHRWEEVENVIPLNAVNADTVDGRHWDDIVSLVDTSIGNTLIILTPNIPAATGELPIATIVPAATPVRATPAKKQS